MTTDRHWTIIPASIRTDKNLLPEAKLLYGDILGLSGRTGYCWAKSNYFEEVSGLSRRQLFRALDQLDDSGYIKREGGGHSRKIFPVLTVTPMAQDSDVEGTDDSDANGTDTNTSFTITYTKAFDYFFERGLHRTDADSLAHGFVDYDRSTPLTKKNWRRAAATWLNRAIDFGQVKRPDGPCKESEIADPQTGQVDTTKWRKRKDGWYR